MTYDQQFRHKALAHKDLNWSVTDPRLYNEAFTSCARSINRCTFCLQDDHTNNYCPHNQNRSVFGWFPDMTSWPTVSPAANPSFPKFATSHEICRHYNDGRCKQMQCKYYHTCTCSGCQGANPLINCPLCLANQTTERSHSPPRRGLPATLPGHISPQLFYAAEKELIPIILACAAWGYSWRGRQVVCQCGNQVVVAYLRSDLANIRKSCTF